MEAKSAAIWRSVDARSEESEMIDHLKSMFWSSSDVDLNLYSPNSSDNSCVTFSTLPSSLFLPLADDKGYGAVPFVVATDMDMCCDHQHQAITPRSNVLSGDKRKFHMDEQQQSHKKKTRTARSVSRTPSSSVLDDENGTEVLNHSCSSGCSSEEDSIVTSEKSTALKRSGNPTGHRKSPKESQSLYAKKRRERINERLRVLQKIVPNGTKVDISTMLEEAVQYVKFLQLQIKLLSSDDTWMYAPLAYNGMNTDLSLGLAANQE